MSQTQSNGQGLEGRYFNSPDFTALRATRLDGAVDFQWARILPAPEITNSAFSVRWLGTVEPRYSESHTFFLETDAGSGGILWVNNRRLVVHNASPYIETGDHASISLQAGQRYDIKVEYIHGSNAAAVKLAWASSSQQREVVPSSRLHPYEPPKSRSTFGNLGKPWPIPGKVQLENFDIGTASDPAYHVGNASNQAPGDEFYRDGKVSIGVDFILDLADVGWVNVGDWLEYTVAVDHEGLYDISIRYATPLDGKSIGPVLFAGIDKTGLIPLSKTGDWGSDLKGGQAFNVVTVKNVRLSAGVQTMRVCMGSAGFTADWINIESK